MDGRLPALLIAIILMNALLSPVVVSGCAADTGPVGPQEPVGPHGAVGPQGSSGPHRLVGPQEALAPQTTSRPQQMIGNSGPMGQQQFDGGPDRIGPADPVVLAARVLKLVGLATPGD
jgi:hypothetical protein